MDSNVKEKIRQMSEAKFKILAKADRESRQLTIEEEVLVNELEGALQAYLREQPVERALTVPQNAVLSGGSWKTTTVSNGKPYALRTPGASKNYSDLFGAGGYQWEDRQIDFFQAVFSGRAHPGLIQNASMSETTPSDGGFLIPTEYAKRIHDVSLESELVMPRCYVQPMTSNELKLPALSIGSHNEALLGGFEASYKAELATITEKNPKTRSMTLNAKKLTGMIRMSNELATDIPGGSDQIVNLCGNGLGWYRDRAFLKGSGSGQPLGILKSDCLVTVDPEGGQGSGVIYENLTKMMSRMFAGSFKNSVWVCHQTLIPSLLQLSIAVGTGGSHVPVLTESNGAFKILTRPVIFTEKTESLGTKGDIMLCDFSQYVVGLRSGMRFDTSIHAHFATDELLARIIERHDGQPLWDSPLTLADGSTTVSPFVTLGDR